MVQGYGAAKSCYRNGCSYGAGTLSSVAGVRVVPLTAQIPLQITKVAIRAQSSNRGIKADKMATNHATRN